MRREMAFSVPLRTFIIVILILIESSKCIELVSRIQINKCVCPIDQILNPLSDTCENVTDELYIRFWNQSKSTIDIIDINQNNAISATIADLKCKEGFIKITSKRWDYLIDNVGKLKHHLFPSTDEYCMEKYRDGMGHVRQYFEYCKKEKKIPQCCGARQSLNSNGICQDLDSKFDGVEPWSDDYNFETLNVECYNKPRFHSIESTFGPNNNLDVNDPNFEIKNSILKSRSYSSLEKYEADSTPYCLGLNETDLSYVVKVCYSDELNWNYKKDLTPVPYCCMENYAVNLDNLYECIPHNETFNRSAIIEETDLVIEPIQFQVRCFRFQLLQLTHNDKYKLESDGTIISYRGQRIHGSRYCLGLTKIKNRTFSAGFTCVRYPRTWLPTMAKWCLVISTVFTIFTLIVYIGIKEIRNKIFSFCLINQQIVTLFRNLSLLVLYKIHYTNSNACLATGIFDIINSLALFLWLNVICFDVWNSFLGSESFSNKRRAGDGKKRLMMKYMLYGWGLPLIAAATILSIQLIKHPDRNYVGATKYCERIQGGYFAFMFTTQSLLLLINLFIFAHLSYHLVKIRKDRSSAGYHSWLPCFKICLKLFLIMGLGFVISLVRVLIYKYTEDLPIYYYVRFCDIIINDLQGLYIFIIFVLTRRTWEKIREQLMPNKFRNNDEIQASLSQPKHDSGNKDDDTPMEIFQPAYGSLS